MGVPVSDLFEKGIALATRVLIIVCSKVKCENKTTIIHSRQCKPRVAK